MKSGDTVCNRSEVPGAEEDPYWLYLLECEGGTLYSGIAKDVEERFFKHLFGRGARYTRANPPMRVVAAAMLPNKSHALRAEISLKATPRSLKREFVESLASNALDSDAASVPRARQRAS